MLSTDFWWLSSDQETRYAYTELSHHRPMPDHEQPNVASWDKEIYPINQTNHWRERFQNANVYRNLKLTTTLSNGQDLIGPFLIDIDNERDNLDDALDVARNALCLLQGQFDISASNLKIFFTGHKGFNLEVHPQILGIQGSIKDQIVSCGHFLERIIQGLRRGKSWKVSNQVSDVGTLIDTIYGNRLGYKLKHPYVRLHRSLNKWVMPNGIAKTRMKIELAVDELNRFTIREIISVAESENSII